MPHSGSGVAPHHRQRTDPGRPNTGAINARGRLTPRRVTDLPNEVRRLRVRAILDNLKTRERSGRETAVCAWGSR